MSFAKRFLGNIGTILEFMTRSETLTEKKLKQMSLPVDFHASRSRLLEKEKEPMTIDTSGMKLLELLPKQNQDGLLEKMLKALLTSPKVKSCSRYKKIWKAKASRSNVLLFQLQVSVLGTKEKEFGLLPTPRASAAMNEDLETIRKRNKYNSKLEEKVAFMYPTPAATNIATPQPDRVEMNKSGGFLLRKKNKPHMTYGARLQDVVHKMYPTPTVGCEEGGEQSNRVEQTKSGGFILRKKNKPKMTYGAKLSDAMLYLNKPKAGGKLNPDFVEFLMAYPTNWTKIEQTELKR